MYEPGVNFGGLVCICQQRHCGSNAWLSEGCLAAGWRLWHRSGIFAEFTAHSSWPGPGLVAPLGVEIIGVYGCLLMPRVAVQGSCRCRKKTTAGGELEAWIKCWMDCPMQPACLFVLIVFYCAVCMQCRAGDSCECVLDD